METQVLAVVIDAASRRDDGGLSVMEDYRKYLVHRG